MRKTLVLVLLAAGCGSSNTPPRIIESADAGTPGEPPMDLAMADQGLPHHEGGEGDGGVISDGGIGASDAAPMKPPMGDGGVFVPPPPSDPAVVHAPATPISVGLLLPGVNVLDVAVDQGGGVWAVSASAVYYFAPGQAAPFTYDQTSGLARGQSTWTDTWFSPGTYPVTFQSVSAGMPGQAIVGNIGEIADRLQVNPSTGAVIKIDNMQVTMANTNAAEFPEHLKRVVAVWRSVVDLNGTLEGTAYLGGFHGFYAFHGLTADCGCLAFEEHQHYITDTAIGGGDVKGLAITSTGDLYQGDRDFVTLLPQRSRGATTGLFDYDFTWGIDVFPNVRDEVNALAADASDGVYVASEGNGLAYLAPATHAASYWSSATRLPQNRVRGVALDAQGDVWIGTAQAGVARYRPSTDAWTYYTQASGLPSAGVNTVYFDKLTGGARIYLATDNGIAIATP